MPFCTNCGKETMVGSYCGFCGTSLAQNPPPPPPEQQPQGKGFWNNLSKKINEPQKRACQGCGKYKIGCTTVFEYGKVGLISNSITSFKVLCPDCNKAYEEEKHKKYIEEHAVKIKCPYCGSTKILGTKCPHCGSIKDQ
jgi:hypothetical protein